MAKYTSMYTGSQIDARLGYVGQNLKITASPSFAGLTLSGLTATTVPYLNGSKDLTSSSVTPTELGYLSGVTSDIQTQLNDKQATITGGATTILSSNLTASRVLISNGSGKVSVSPVTSTQIGYLSNVTSDIQTQIGTKVTGPISATDNAIVRFDSTTGKLIQNSNITIDDDGSVNIPSGQSYKINNSAIAYSDVGAASNDLGNVSANDFVTKMKEAERLTGTKYGVKVQIGNSNPETSVTPMYYGANFPPSYTDGVTGEFVDNGWSKRFPFNAIKPCVFKNGAVVYYLDPNDYTKKADGTASTITGADGDVMIEVPKMYMKISSDANYHYFEISSVPETGFTDYPFSYKGVVKDKFYIGAYKGWVEDLDIDVLRSVSGKTPTANLTRAQFRTLAQANGTGYEIVPYNKLILLQVLYLIRFQNLNSQTALGQGNVNSTLKATGTTNALGMCYGSTSDVTQIKCLGIEDFWGNIWEWIDGLTTGTNTIYTQDGNFSDVATDGTLRGTPGANYSGYISNIRGTNELGFLISETGTSGSDSTYYCDYGDCHSSCVTHFGGCWANGSDAGAFLLCVLYAASASFVSIGARLAFCG